MKWERYTKLPEIWRQVLLERKTPASVFKLAWWLLEKAKFSPKVKVSNVAAAKMRISPSTKLRALEWLAAAGLIRLETKNGTSPRVVPKWLA